MATPEEIGEDYARSLADLTFNSRPIIQSLTLIAQENVHAAEQIAQAIERQIAKAVPSRKLFVLYLLDSISKNIGAPYNILFGQNLFKLFTEAYVLVNDEVRTKFIALFKTWKLATTEAGLPLFPADQIHQIETFLERATRRNRSAQPALTVDMLVKEIDLLCAMVQERLARSPADQKASERFKVLLDLKRIITTQRIAPQQLQVVHTQLVGIRKDETDKRRQPAQAQPPAQPSYPGFAMVAGAPLPQRTTPEPPLKRPAAPSFATDQLQALLGLKTPPPPPVGEVSSILSSLSQSGVFEKLNLKPAPPQPQPQQPKIDQQSLQSLLGLSKIDVGSSIALSGTVVSEDQVLARFELSQHFLSSHQPTADEIALIYDSRPNKCSNCAKRFASSADGNARLQEHLDWHFRMNKRLNQNEVKTISNRAYYLDDEKWVSFRDDELLGGLDDTAVETARPDDAPRGDRYVVVPSDSTDLATECQICKEKISAEFNDDLGEWIWANCVSVKDRDGNDRNYHHTCYVEARGTKRDRSPG